MRTQENFSFVYCERSNSRDLGEVLQGLLGSTPETARDFDACLLSEKTKWRVKSLLAASRLMMRIGH